MPHASLLPTLLVMLVPVAAPVEGAGLVQRTYAVADLVVPLSQAGAGPRTAATPAAPATVDKQLIQLITETVAPESWERQGGRGSVTYHEPGMALVVRQTADVQERVADLLASLRRLQDTQVVLEFKILSLPETFFERIGIDFDVHVAGDKNTPPAPPAVQVTRTPTWQDIRDLGTLTDKQVAALLEAVQGDRRSNVMQAPKVTMFNGQEAVIQAGEERRFVTGYDVDRSVEPAAVTPRVEVVQTGLRLAARPAVTPDGRSVVVQMKASQTDLEPAVALMPVGPVDRPGELVKDGQRFVQQPAVRRLAVENTLTIPDGGTVILGGLSHTVETRLESSPPMLSKVPYVNRLFKNVGVGRETQQWVMLVTARVIRESGDEKEETRTEALRRGYGEVQKLCPGTPLAALAARAATAPGAASAATVRGASEEQESPVGEGSRAERVLAELVRAYDAACAAGRKDEAARLAGAALALDPTCFQRRR